MDCGIWEKNTFRDKRLQSVMEGVYRDLGNDFGCMDGEEKERNAAILARMEPYILEYKKDAGDSIRFGGRENVQVPVTGRRIRERQGTVSNWDILHP